MLGANAESSAGLADVFLPGPCHRRDFPYRETMNDEVLSSSEALTFDDEQVVPGWIEVLPTECDTSTS